MQDETCKYRPAQVSTAAPVEGSDGSSSGTGASFVQISCGGMHTVALDGEGKVWTWGVNDEGALGRKTEGTCWEGAQDLGVSSVPGLAEMPASAGAATQIAAGDGFTFALCGGSVYGCGLFKDDQGGITGFHGAKKGLQVRALTGFFIRP